MIRRLLVFASLAIGLLAIAAAGLIVFRVALAEMLLPSQLASLGVPAVEVRVKLEESAKEDIETNPDVF